MTAGTRRHPIARRTRLPFLILMVFAFVLAAEDVIVERGWRAWVAPFAVAWLVGEFVDEIRAIRRRRASAAPEPS